MTSTMNEAYLMSDSVTSSTFIVTKNGELLTFEEYQKAKESNTSNNQNAKFSSQIFFPTSYDNDLKKAQGILQDSQQTISSRTTIKNMLAYSNEETGNTTLGCLAKTAQNNTNQNNIKLSLPSSTSPQPDQYDTAQGCRLTRLYSTWI